MRQFAAILGDSFREAFDRKILILLLLLTSLPILVCASISFRREPLEETLRTSASRLNRVRYRGRAHDFERRIEGKFTVGEVRPVVPEEWPPELAGGHVLEIAFGEPGYLDNLVRAFEDVRNRVFRGRTEEERPAPAATPEQKIRFLQERFTQDGFNRVAARAEGEAGDRFLIALRSDYPFEVRGGHTMTVLFGLFPPIPVPISIAELVVRMELGLAEIFAGVVIMVIAVVSTAGFIPSMLARGTLDLVLARPIGRMRLLLFKYAGGLWFIALFATILIAGTWAALSARAGFVNPWYLFSIVTVVATFAVLHAVSTLCGVLTRSAGLSAIVALGTWAVASALVSIHHAIKMLLFGTDVPAAVIGAFDAAYIVLPKTKDLSVLTTYALARSHLSPAAFERTFGGELPQVDWAFSLGTTALFTVLMLALACWKFHRRDY